MNGTDGRFVLIGRIVGVHGLSGELKIESYTEPRLRIFDYRPWTLRFASGEHEIEAIRGRAQGRGLVGQLAGVADRDAATGWVGSEIWVARSVLPAAGPGEYYWSDLEGLEVVTVAGTSLGKVSHLIATGANDVLVVRSGERERLIPFVPGRFVTEIDLESGRLKVDWDPEF